MAELTQIREVELHGLFGQYTHKIRLNTEDRVTILYGPNGIGKTITLRLIHALFAGSLDEFRKVPLERMVVRMRDGTCITIQLTAYSAISTLVELSLEQPDSAPIVDHVTIPVTEVKESEKLQKQWQRALTRETFRSSAYANPFTAPQLWTEGEPENPKLPDWLDRLRSNVACRFVEAKRLDSVEAVPSAAIARCAEELDRRIWEAISRYVAVSQQLDQTFPQRVLDGPGGGFSLEDLRPRLDALREKQTKFQQFALLDERSPAPPALPLQRLDDTRREVLSLYVRDTEAKLAELDVLARRIDLFLRHVNEKLALTKKSIRIWRGTGFCAVNAQDQVVPLDALSSGEQHQIVLVYELLFRTSPNTLVLIDEPELSLHLSWQKRFLPELLEIVKEAGFDVLMATHSPFIMGGRVDLGQKLATDPEEGDAAGA